MQRSLVSLLAVLGLLASAFPALAGPMEDADEDGFGADVDCDDNNADVNPDAVEICDEEDNDCDCTGDTNGDGEECGVGDDGVDDLDDNHNPDADADGDNSALCGGTDCDDSDPELNELDLDGDSQTSCTDDCDDSDAALNELDVDGDGTTSCDGDCDDTDIAADPNTEEICGDEIDNDCSGAADDIDLDGDESISPDCGGDDCDDTNAAINPAIGEDGATCIDRIDNDCDCPGDTNGDGTVCGQGDEGVDGLDEDCHAAPTVNAGPDQQDRYLGGTAIVVLDGSASSDDNSDDVLSYTWTVTARAEDAGVTWELLADPTSPFAYLTFRADPQSESLSWVFDANLVVSDGIFSTEVEDEGATAVVTFFRATSGGVATGCAVGPRGGAGAAALLVLLALAVGGRRRWRA